MSKERELLNRSRYNLDREYCADLIDEIQELLAQPEQEQEPVAWIIETEIEGKLSEWVCTDKKHYMDASDGKDPIPLYTAPPTREPFGPEERQRLSKAYSTRAEQVAFEEGIIFAKILYGIGGGE